MSGCEGNVIARMIVYCFYHEVEETPPFIQAVDDGDDSRGVCNRKSARIAADRVFIKEAVLYIDQQ